MNDIFRVPDMSAKGKGRPRTVEIRGSSEIAMKPAPTQIIGASVAGDPEILDSTTKSELPTPDVHAHEEVVVEGRDRIRSPETKNPQVELRARVSNKFDASRDDEL